MDALTRKLVRLRDRFARMKWDEQAHPRADDGKFGDGGGSSESRPAALAKPQELFDTSTEATAWAKTNVVTEGGVSNSEAVALRRYQSTAGYHAMMNHSLRDPTYTTSPDNQAAIKEMDAVMARSMVKAPVIVQRGISAAVAARLNLKVGASYQDKGFCSTTLDTTTADTFSGRTNTHDAAGNITGSVRSGTICEIHVPAGAHGVYLKGKGESELVLDRSARFEITEVTQHGKQTRVKMTLIPKGTARPGAPQPRITSSLHGATLKQQEDEDTGDPGRFSWGEGDLESIEDDEEAGTEEPAPDRTPQTVVPWEGDTLGSKLLRLRDRFVRLKSDWSEGDHPRDDSGKFGEGGGGGDKRPAAAEKPARAKPGAEFGKLADPVSKAHAGAEASVKALFELPEKERRGQAVPVLRAELKSLRTSVAESAGKLMPKVIAQLGERTGLPEESFAGLKTGLKSFAKSATADAAHKLGIIAHEIRSGALDEGFALEKLQGAYDLEINGHDLIDSFETPINDILMDYEDAQWEKSPEGDAGDEQDGRAEKIAADAKALEKEIGAALVTHFMGRQHVYGVMRDRSKSADPVRRKAIHLMGRFRKLLKWDEFHHPRDDDGKFGSGGGSGESPHEPSQLFPAQSAPAKPAAKPKPAPKKPAAKKPAKPPKADAAKVHAGIAELLASGETLTAQHVARIATALQGLTVKEIGEIKTRLGVKASGTKAALAQSIAEKAVAGVKAKPEAMPSAVQAATPKPEAGAPAVVSPAAQQAPAKFAADDVSRHLDGPGRTAAEKEIAHTAAHLDKAGKAVVRKFTGKLYVEINKEVRSGKPGKHKKTIDALRQTLDAAPILETPVTVYRGASLKPADRAKIMAAAEKALAEGGEMAMKGFTSTSLSPFKAENFARQYHANEPLMLEMSCQKGIYCEGLTHEKGELEFLANDGARYRVKGIKKIRYGHPDYPGKNIQTIQLEQIV